MGIWNKDQWLIWSYIFGFAAFSHKLTILTKLMMVSYVLAETSTNKIYKLKDCYLFQTMPLISLWASFTRSFSTKSYVW